MDLTEAEEIKKRWQENTEELYKKDLHDQDNHYYYYNYYYYLTIPCGLQDLSSLTRNRTQAHGSETTES